MEHHSKEGVGVSVCVRVCAWVRFYHCKEGVCMAVKQAGVPRARGGGCHAS